MNFKHRTVRLAVALSIAGAIATQIPMNSGIALARDGYGDRGNTGGRTAIQVGVAGLVLYGVFATATGGGGAVGGAAGGAGGAGGGSGIIPPVTDTSKKSIWDVANGSDDMNTFADAADKAGIKDDLRKAGQFTAFVPTDSAFASAPLGTVPTNVSFKITSGVAQTPGTGKMTAEQKTAMANLLRGHLIAGRYTIDQLKEAATPAGTDGVPYTTLAGTTIKVTFVDNVLKVNDAVIEQSDIPTSNGIIHKINAIIK